MVKDKNNSAGIRIHSFLINFIQTYDRSVDLL